MEKRLRKLKVAVLLCDGFEESEMTDPKKALEEEGAIVHLISPDASKVTSWQHNKWGEKFKVDRKLKKVSPKDYDGLLLPGGVMNPDKLRTFPEAVKFIK